MSSKSLCDILNYEIGDEVWWFKINDTQGVMYHLALAPGQIELVHDTIKEFKEGRLVCWHTTKSPSEVWGKTRQEAWDRLKSELEKWGSLS